MVKKWNCEYRLDILIKLSLLTVSPLLAVVYAFRRLNTISSYCVLFLCSASFGAAFTVISGRSSIGNGVGYDGEFYRAKFESFVGTDLNTFLTGLRDFVLFDSVKKDYYFETLSFFVSRFTDNYHALFFVAALIFSYFSLKSLRYISSDENFKASLSSYILVYLFLINQIFNINGLRFWTAAWIAVFCILKLYRDNDRRFYLLVLATPFFHGSFWVFVSLVLFAKFLKSFDKFWLVVFFISFVISPLSLEIINFVKPFLPEVLEKMTKSYTSVAYIESKGQWSGFGFLSVIFDSIKSFYLALMVLVLYKHSNEIKEVGKTRNVYLFTIYWVGVFNFFMFIPSLGARFITIAYPLIAYLWLVTFSGKRYNALLYVLPVAFLWEIISQLIMYKNVTNIDFYIFSPLYTFYRSLFIG